MYAWVDTKLPSYWMLPYAAVQTIDLTQQHVAIDVCMCGYNCFRSADALASLTQGCWCHGIIDTRLLMPWHHWHNAADALASLTQGYWCIIETRLLMPWHHWHQGICSYGDDIIHPNHGIDNNCIFNRWFLTGFHSCYLLEFCFSLIINDNVDTIAISKSY